MKEYVLCSPPPAEMLQRDSCRQEAWEWEGEEEEEEGEEEEEEEDYTALQQSNDAEVDGGGAIGAPAAWHKERVLSRGARSHAARCHDEQLLSSLANRISILEQEKNAVCEKLKVFFLSG
jgi:L-lactate utilization protein LutC